MELRVSAPGKDLTQEEIDGFTRDLEKIDRRLARYDLVSADLRINGHNGVPDFQITLDVKYSRNHLIATAEHKDMGQAVRAAREEILRQINDRSRGSHSDYAKGR